MRVIRCGETAYVVSKSFAIRDPTIDSDRHLEARTARRILYLPR